MGLSTGIGIGIQFSRGGGGGQSWEQQWQTIASDEYQAIYDAMTVKPTGLDLAVQNWLVYQLKDKSYWDKFDVLRYYGAQSNDNKEALLDWKNPADGASMMKGTYGTFEGTETWLKYGNNLVENIGGAIKITYVDNTSGAYRALTSTYIDPVTVVGKPYTIRARCKIESGTASLREVYSTVSIPITSADYEWYEINFVRHASNCYIGITTSAGAVVYCDEYYIFESHKAIAVNTPTFTASEGFTGVAASNTYLDQLYHFATSAVKLTLNSASHILYILNNIVANDSIHGAGVGAGTARLCLTPQATTKYLTFHNNCVSSCGTFLNFERQGLYVNTRTAADKVQLYKNKELKIDSVVASTALPARNAAGLAASSQDAVKITASNYTNDQVFIEAYGEGFSQSEAEGITDIINSAATYLGINVYKNDYKFDKPILILTFDNCQNGWQSIGLPYFQSKGVYPTLYIATSEPDTIYPTLTWANILGWHNAGMDIQCHTKTHPYLDTLTYEQIIAELTDVNAAFVANGLPLPVHHAYPFGVYNDTVISAVSTMRLTGRAYYDPDDDKYRHIFKYVNKYEIPSYRIDRLTYSEADIRAAFKTEMDKAIAVNGAIVAIGHNIGNTGGTETQTTDLDYWIAYAQANNMDIMTISEFYELLD